MSEPTPPYKSKHHRHASWTSTWRDANGKPHTKRWGRADKVSRSQAVSLWRAWMETDYPRIKSGLNQSPAVYPVSKLCADWYAEMQKGYNVDGKYTTTIVRMRIALDSFGEMYGNEESDAMTAGKVALWLEAFASNRLIGLKHSKRAKGTVNLGLSYVKRMFRWGATYRGVSPAAAGSVIVVSNMRADSSLVRRKASITSVSEEVFQATCKEASPTIQAMLWLMWWTGARPGEIRSMRPCDINMSREVWVYKPAKHKNSWRGKQRHIAIGPKARAILEPLLPSKMDAHVFTTEAGKPMDVQAFALRVVSAANRAKVPVWHPNQIRHSFATRIRETHGALAVQEMLGHAQLNQQQTYVDSTIQRAILLAKEVG